MALERTKAGWALELRIGAGRRRTFTLVAPDRGTAEARARVVQELARSFVSSGRLLEAHKAMVDLTQGGDDFDSIAQAFRDLCAEPLPAAAVGAAPITFEQLGTEWTRGELATAHKGHVFAKEDTSQDESRLGVLYALPSSAKGRTLGEVPIVELTLDDADAAMAKLPESVESNSTRRQYAQCIRRVMKLAVYPCKLITASPIPSGFCPPPSKQPDYTCLYPSEDRQLLACAEIDLSERALYGFAVRWGLRLGSLMALTWRHVDLEQGIVRTLAKDTRGGKKLIEFALEPDEWRTLSALRALCPNKPESASLFPQLDRTSICKRFRAAMLLAGLKRTELFVSVDTCEALRFHDLRASFVTFALLAGRPMAWIMKRTGHRSSQMIERYRRDHLARLPLPHWIPLDEALGLASPAGREVEDGGNAPGGSGPPEPVAGAELALEGGDEIAPAGVPGELEELGEHVLGNRTAGAVPAAGVAHGAPSFTEPPVNRVPPIAAESASEGVAARVAAGFWNVVGVEENCFMIPTSSQGGSKGIRTLDLRIKSSAGEAITQHAERSALHETTRDDSRAHEAPASPPVRASSLTEDMLRELAELAQQGQRWRALAAVATDLAVHEESRATRSNVTLLVERRRGAK